MYARVCALACVARGSMSIPALYENAQARGLNIQALVTLWSSLNHLLTHVIIVRVACGSNIQPLDRLNACIEVLASLKERKYVLDRGPTLLHVSLVTR